MRADRLSREFFRFTATVITAKMDELSLPGATR